jgi:NADPH:quinone reductase-like Zn-dependent oxidoreductase
MNAIVQDRYGSADVLALREVDRPVAANNEVLVQVHAAEVNAYDWHLMRGDPVSTSDDPRLPPEVSESAQFCPATKHCRNSR